MTSGVNTFARDAMIETEIGTLRLDTLVGLFEYGASYIPAILIFNQQTAAVEKDRLIWAGRTKADEAAMEIHVHGQALTVAPTQLVYTLNRGWVTVALLTPYDEIVTLDKQQIINSTTSFSVTTGPEGIFMWGLLTESGHAVFANRVLVQ